MEPPEKCQPQCLIHTAFKWNPQKSVNHRRLGENHLGEHRWGFLKLGGWVIAGALQRPSKRCCNRALTYSNHWSRERWHCWGLTALKLSPQKVKKVRCSVMSDSLQSPDCLTKIGVRKVFDIFSSHLVKNTLFSNNTFLIKVKVSRLNLIKSLLTEN